MEVLPRWVDIVLIPLISLLLAAVISAIVILAIGEDPIEAVQLMVEGALGSSYGWGYTLYYATNFIFTGLAVAVAFHARMFNIGGEGQALLGGLGVALAVLLIPWPHWTLALVGATAAAAIFGAAWAAIPAYLQATRGSHIVITTIMFNFIGAAVLNYVLVNQLRPTGQMEPASGLFPEPTHLPTLHDLLAPIGIEFSGASPANVTLASEQILRLQSSITELLIWQEEPELANTRYPRHYRTIPTTDRDAMQVSARKSAHHHARTISDKLLRTVLAGLDAINSTWASPSGSC